MNVPPFGIPPHHKSRSVKVKSSEEPWMFVHLEDGTIIKHRIIVVGVIQVLNDDLTPFIDETGCGVYAIQGRPIQVIEHSPMIEERQKEDAAIIVPLNKRN